MQARQLYQVNDQIKLHNKLIINVNNLPGLDADEATQDRLIVFDWKTKFVEYEHEVDEENRMFLANDKYASKAYWKQAAPQLVNLLLRHYKTFKDNKRRLEIPESIQEYTRKFCEGNDPFMKWFNQNFILKNI